MFTFISANLNGIRSAHTKGFFDWLQTQPADAVGVQEIKAQAPQLDGVYDHVGDMRGWFAPAEKKGYSGVGLYSRHEPSDVLRGLGCAEFDAEGRWVELRFDRPGRKLSLISAYFPSGSSGPDRQAAKYRFLDVVGPHLRDLMTRRDFILVGDVNIAHTQADLKNWRSNQQNSGFLPEERAWMTDLLGAGLVDVYRHLCPDATDAGYTWWSNRGQAYANNVGWRIDYQIATPALAALARGARIYKGQKFSDHAPLTVTYDLDL